MNKEENKTIIIQKTNGSNASGTIGLIFAILSWPFSCFPIFGSIFWLIGLIFSIVGLFKKPRGAAIAGLVISFLGLILIVLVIVGIVGSVGLSEFMNLS